VELRALCNEVPRTPPGPEGSNGTGITSGAADHPKFLSLKQFSVISRQVSVRKTNKDAMTPFLPCLLKTIRTGKSEVFSERNAERFARFFLH